MLTNVEKKIPLNRSKKDFFKIIVNKNSFCIDILFNWKDQIDLENLFFILKSYLLEKEILIKNVFIIASSENIFKNFLKPNFFRNINLKKIEKINFFDFKLFYEEMFENDWEFYLNNFDLYGIRIFILKNSKIWENQNYYPIYPFNENFKNLFIQDNSHHKKIIKLMKENYILKKKINLYFSKKLK